MGRPRLTRTEIDKRIKKLHGDKIVVDWSRLDEIPSIHDRIILVDSVHGHYPDFLRNVFHGAGTHPKSRVKKEIGGKLTKAEINRRIKALYGNDVKLDWSKIKGIPKYLDRITAIDIKYGPYEDTLKNFFRISRHKDRGGKGRAYTKRYLDDRVREKWGDEILIDWSKLSGIPDKFDRVPIIDAKYGSLMQPLQSLLKGAKPRVRFGKVKITKAEFDKITYSNFKGEIEILWDKVPKNFNVNTRVPYFDKVLNKVQIGQLRSLIAGHLSMERRALSHKLTVKELEQALRNKHGKMVTVDLKRLPSDWSTQKKIWFIDSELGPFFCHASSVIHGGQRHPRLDSVELNKIHPLYEKLFKTLRLRYCKEVCISSRSRIDFVVEVDGSKIGIEVKADEKRSIRKGQIERYKEDGIHFGLTTVIISSPNGKHGISMDDLRQTLLKRKFGFRSRK